MLAQHRRRWAYISPAFGQRSLAPCTSVINYTVITQVNDEAYIPATGATGSSCTHPISIIQSPDPLSSDQKTRTQCRAGVFPGSDRFSTCQKNHEVAHRSSQQYSSKHDTLKQCCFSAGPAIKQHCVNVSRLLRLLWWIDWQWSACVSLSCGLFPPINRDTLPSAGSMLGQCHAWWPAIAPELVKDVTSVWSSRPDFSYDLFSNPAEGANTSLWNHVALMLAQRLRRWANINPTLVQRLVISGKCVFIIIQIPERVYTFL